MDAILMVVDCRHRASPVLVAALGLLLGCAAQPATRDYSGDPRAAVEAIVHLGKAAQVAAAEIMEDVAADEERAKPLMADGEAARLRGDKAAYVAALRSLVALKVDLVARMDARQTLMRHNLGAIADIATSTKLSESQQAEVLSVLKPGNDAVRTTDVALQSLRDGQARMLHYIESIK